MIVHGKRVRALYLAGNKKIYDLAAVKRDNIWFTMVVGSQWEVGVKKRKVPF